MKALIFCLLLLGLGSCAVNDNNQAFGNNPDSTDIPKNVDFIARGTEPFWSVDVTRDDGIVYSSLLDDQKQTFSYVEPLIAYGRPADLLRVYRIPGRGNNMLIIRKVDACSDGMSDIEYPYSAIFIQGNMVLEGCAEQKH